MNIILATGLCALIVFNAACASKLVTVDEYTQNIKAEGFDKRTTRFTLGPYKYLYSRDRKNFYFTNIQKNNSDKTAGCKITLNETIDGFLIFDAYELWNEKLLLVDRYWGFLIVDPNRCTLDVLKKIECARVFVNSDSFDCLDFDLSGPPTTVHRYDGDGELVRRFPDADRNLMFAHKFKKATEDRTYFSWQGQNLIDPNEDELEIVFWNSTYGMTDRKLVPMEAGTSFLEVRSAENDRLTACQMKEEFIYTHNDTLTCKSVDMHDTTEIMKFEITLPAGNDRPPWRFEIINLPRGIFLLYRSADKKMYYRIVNEGGEIDTEDRLFWEFDEVFSSVINEMKFELYEENDNVCCKMHNINAHLFTKCVKVLL